MKKIFTSIFLLLSTIAYGQNVQVKPNSISLSDSIEVSIDNDENDLTFENKSSKSIIGLRFYKTVDFFGTLIDYDLGGLKSNFEYTSLWSADKINFAIGDPANSKMTVAYNGFIGIGTSDPKFLFDLRNNVAANDTMFRIYNEVAAVTTKAAFGSYGLISERFSPFVGNRFMEGLKVSSLRSLNLEGEERVTFIAKNKQSMIVDSLNVTINPQPSTFGIFGSLSIIAAKANLDVHNTIRSAELDFAQNSTTEKRAVFADKDGILRLKNNPNVYFVSGRQAVQVSPASSNDLVTGVEGARFTTTNQNYVISLPISVPNGSKITSIKVFYYDNATANLEIWLGIRGLSSISYVVTNLYHTTGALASIRNQEILSNPVTVNNAVEDYFIYAANIDANWPSNQLYISGAAITYEY